MTPPPDSRGHLVTLDGRHLVAHGRLWRRADPRLAPTQRTVLRRTVLVQALMAARRAKKQAMRQADPAAREAARSQVEAAKQTPGERGPAWRDDGALDHTRRLAGNPPHADWFAGLAAAA